MRTYVLFYKFSKNYPKKSGEKWGVVVNYKKRWAIIMFMGEYKHNTDEKGRMIMPAKFRETLGDSFVVTRGLDQCLFVYPMDEWRILEEKIKKLPLTKKIRAFSRFFFSGATGVNLSRSCNLPAPLRNSNWKNLCSNWCFKSVEFGRIQKIPGQSGQHFEAGYDGIWLLVYGRWSPFEHIAYYVRNVDGLNNTRWHLLMEH